jgi:uncharacterized repeat protein (TIGR03847 family)
VARQVFRFDPPERFVAGTVGRPGERVFYLQAKSAQNVTSVLLEKEQVAALAERLDELLDRIVLRAAGQTSVPAVVPADLADNDPLELPLVEEFRVGPIALAWDEAAERVVIEAHAQVEGGDESTEAAFGDEDSDDGADMLLVRLPGDMARAFAARSMALVASGRPPCPLCGEPLDPGGHICPRKNGKLR